jgi:hypothetical protein
LIPVFWGLIAFLGIHEWEIWQRRSGNEKFMMHYFESSFVIEKLGCRLTISGDVKHAKTQDRIRKKLKNYIQQTGVETIQWKSRGRDSP